MTSSKIKVRSNIQRCVSLGAILAVFLGWGAGPILASEPCLGHGPNSDQAFNNCPFITGVFQSADQPNQRVTVRLQDNRSREYNNSYIYEVSKGNVEPLRLWDFVIEGTQDRPEYWFRNGKVFHVVIFRPSDPNVIRLKILELDRVLSNQLLYRISD